MGDHDTEIDGLIDEHRDLMTIMGALRRTMNDPSPDEGKLLDQLETALAAHTRREEAGLFQVLGQLQVPPQYIGRFDHDHTHLVDLIHAVRSDRSGIEVLLNSLDAHIAREEDDMFPAAEQLLGPADWDAVQAAVARLS
jgi:hemerythrin-like domain-containing protein